MINRYGASESPCSTPATMSKQSVSSSGERTFTFIYIYMCIYYNINEREFRDKIAKVVDYGFKVSEFELQSCCYVYFRTNNIKRLLSVSNVLNSITAVFLQGWL